jgi:hypothetical protein
MYSRCGKVTSLVGENVMSHCVRLKDAAVKISTIIASILVSTEESFYFILEEQNADMTKISGHIL